jgi:hypothetical protein
MILPRLIETFLVDSISFLERNFLEYVKNVHRAVILRHIITIIRNSGTHSRAEIDRSLEILLSEYQKSPAGQETLNTIGSARLPSPQQYAETKAHL